MNFREKITQEIYSVCNLEYLISAKKSRFLGPKSGPGPKNSVLSVLFETRDLDSLDRRE